MSVVAPGAIGVSAMVYFLALALHKLWLELDFDTRYEQMWKDVAGMDEYEPPADLNRETKRAPAACGCVEMVAQAISWPSRPPKPTAMTHSDNDNDNEKPPYIIMTLHSISMSEFLPLCIYILCRRPSFISIFYPFLLIVVFTSETSDNSYLKPIIDIKSFNQSTNQESTVNCFS